MLAKVPCACISMRAGSAHLCAVIMADVVRLSVIWQDTPVQLREGVQLSSLVTGQLDEVEKAERERGGGRYDHKSL